MLKIGSRISGGFVRKVRALWISVVVFAMTGGGAWAGQSRGPCNDTLAQGIPTRPAGALGGRDFAEQLRGLSDDERESRIQHELVIGNIPDFLRRLVPVRMQQPMANAEPVDLVVCAAPDYLAIGSNSDFLLIPMRLGTALSAAGQYGFTLPTPRMVDAIYAQAAVHFVPQPLPASDQMRSTDYIRHHNDMISAQRSELGATAGSLSAGHKKDLVITNRLWAHLDRVAIYGWHLIKGEPIQGLSTIHGWRYADYSHGVRLISTQVFVDGVPKSIFDVMKIPRLAGALSGEGVMANMTGLIESLSGPAQTTIAVLAASKNRL
jgi:hypothetical protein